MKENLIKILPGIAQIMSVLAQSKEGLVLDEKMILQDLQQCEYPSQVLGTISEWTNHSSDIQEVFHELFKIYDLF